MSRLAMLLLLCLLGTHPAASAQRSSKQMSDLASEKGCDLCHRADYGKAVSNELLAVGPSWRDIATKYHGQKDAQDRLTEIVLSGSGGGGKERHWQGKVHDGGMLPNVKELDEDQARQLVRWILSFSS